MAYRGLPYGAAYGLGYPGYAALTPYGVVPSTLDTASAAALAATGPAGAALSLEWLARDLGYTYANGAWVAPAQSYGNELVTVSLQNQVTIPNLNCLGKNSSYDLQITMVALNSITIFGVGNSYLAPPPSLIAAGLQGTANDPVAYQYARRHLGRSFSLMNSTTQPVVINDWRTSTNNNITNDVFYNIATIMDSSLATSPAWASIVWLPGCSVTFKTVLNQNNVLTFLFDGVTAPILPALRPTVQVPLCADAFSGVTPIVTEGQLIAGISRSGPIPLYTGPAQAGLLAPLTDASFTSIMYGFIVAGQVISQMEHITWFYLPSGSNPLTGSLNPILGTTFNVSTGTIVVATLRVTMLPGWQTPALGSQPFTNNGLGTAGGQAWTASFVLAPDCYGYTLAVTFQF